MTLYFEDKNSKAKKILKQMKICLMRINQRSATTETPPLR